MTRRFAASPLGFALFIGITLPTFARADKIDDFIRAEMKKRRIPGLSLAIIQGGKIVKAKGYGVIEQGDPTPVTTETLFQAGSISKPVAAMGALYLTEKGVLRLDEDVNAKLMTWRVPENEFTKEKKVTLRGLVSHTAGLTVHGFPGYATEATVPSVVQILNGEPPANTPAIRVNVAPGSLWRYSGGGYTILQQMMVDVTGKPFHAFMQETVLTPLGMSHSDYSQPLPSEKASRTATAHTGRRTPVKGRWHLYPEMAAAGLWTTPSDLARFAIEIQQSLAGKSNRVLSQEMTRQMLTAEKNNVGLGLFLRGDGATRQFGHGGRDEGFDADMLAFAETGQGVVIMINTNDNSNLFGRIRRAVAKEYQWKGFSTPEAPPTVKVARKTLQRYAGRYELANNQMITLSEEKGRLMTMADGFPEEECLPIAEDRFFLMDRNASLTFLQDEKGTVTGFRLSSNGQERTVPRLGSLIRHLKKQAPDSARVQRLETVFKALVQGGKAAEASPDLTPGAKRDFQGGVSELASVRVLTFLAEEDLSSRGVERHEGKVARIAYFKIRDGATTQYLLVHLTADGLITDFDLVAD